MKNFLLLFLCFPMLLLAQAPTEIKECNLAYGAGTWPSVISLSDMIFYTQRNTVSDYELYVSDATSSGSYIVKTFTQEITWPHVLNDQLLFLVDEDNDTRLELWTSDGTTAGTVQLIEFALFSAGNPNVSVVGSRAYYQDYTPGGNVYSLYSSDGTAAGSSVAKTWNSGEIHTPHAVDGDQYLFLADVDNDNRTEVWTSDGTAAGTVQLIEFALFNGGYTTTYALDGHVWYLEATNGEAVASIYRTDGTAGGSAVVKTFNNTTVHTPHALGNQFLFVSDTDDDTRQEIWTSDGSSSGTIQLKEFALFSAYTLMPMVLDGHVWYIDKTPGEAVESIYRTDGTVAGTSVVKTFSSGSIFTPHSINGNQYLFLADTDDDDRKEIWTSDGTDAGTVQLIEFALFSANNYIYPTEVNGRVYYQDYTFGNSVFSLYSTDGTAAGSSVAKTFTNDINMPHSINGNQYLFAADSDGDNKVEIWTSDGTDAGTIQLLEFSFASNGSSFWPNAYQLNGIVHYQNQNSTNNSYSLYISDGSVAGSSMSKHFQGVITSPHQLFNHIYMFLADNDNDNRREIWTIDWPYTSTEQIQFSRALEISPNPSNGMVNISTSFAKEYNISVFNALGQLLVQKTMQGQSQQLDLSDLNSGTYFIQVQQGTQLQTKQFVLVK